MLATRRHDRRPAAAALEFCLVAALLFALFLGMIELSRAMMALGAVANAARAATRAGAVTAGGYADIVSAAGTTLTAAKIGGTPEVVVTVNGTVVTSDQSFQAAAVPGATISVKVGVLYSNVSWLPAGTGMFLSPSQKLSETAVLCKEG